MLLEITARLKGDKKSDGDPKYGVPDVDVPVTFFRNTGKSTLFKIRSSVDLRKLDKLLVNVVSVLSRYSLIALSNVVSVKLISILHRGHR